MTPLTTLRNDLVAILDRLTREHDAEHAEARWPQATTDPRPSGETPDPTWRTTQAPDPTNQRRAEHIATTIRNAYGLLQDCENDQRHKADNTRRINAAREGLCVICFDRPAHSHQRCTPCLKYLQRTGEERPRQLIQRDAERKASKPA